MTRASRLAFWLATAALVAASMMTPAAQLKRPSTVKTQAKPVPQPPASSISLAKFFDVGPVFQDKNGDGVVDFVDARIVLGERPSASDVAAGANVAARLAFETSAMNLPMPTTGAGTSIIIGASGMKKAGASIDLPSGANEGLITTMDVGGKPAVVIAGASDAGTRAAADAFARMPKLWDPNGASVVAVAADMQKFLSDHGVDRADVRVPAVYSRARQRLVRACLDRRSPQCCRGRPEGAVRVDDARGKPCRRARRQGFGGCGLRSNRDG